ncbi:peptidyl-prolyl cis-trans isomerase cyp21-1 [Quercus suber]|uniref:Peptidyl-prolyl cis-trans isomerase n=1 Tax=Quercus suber TaxID=58331 RepID=A0AAW0MAL3_QUESU
MRRAISLLVQPRFIFLYVVLLIFLIFAFSNSKKSEEKAEEVPEITHRVYFDIDIEEQRQGRIVIGLYGQVVAKTVENLGLYAQVFGVFLLVLRVTEPDGCCYYQYADYNLLTLNIGEKGEGAHGIKLHYKGTPFHRIVSGFVIQGGDIVHGVLYQYGGGTFPDENFKIKHSHAGVVSMVNSGPDSNGSQLDGEHVVFGKVIQGMDTVFAIEGGAGTYSGKPRKKVVIADSGRYPRVNGSGKISSFIHEQQQVFFFFLKVWFR